jgi:GT2 family glycosyltransferase
MRLSVVIPTVGRPQLARVLQRLELQEARFELIVVEDPGGASPGTAGKLVAACSYPARVLRAESPGASAARNAGWRASDADLVLFMGDDILADAELLKAHLRAHDEHPEPEAGVLGRVDWARELRRTTFMRWLDRGIQFDYDTIAGEEAGWWRLYTSNCSLKRSMLESVGGFDEENLPFLYEDLDLGKRMSDGAGFRLLYERRARAEHLHPVSMAEWRGRAAAIARAERAFVRKHPDFKPYFHDRFSAAAGAPRARGLLARLAPVVPPGAPWIGPRVWASVDRRYTQELAPEFMAAWNDDDEPAATGVGGIR